VALAAAGHDVTGTGRNRYRASGRTASVRFIEANIRDREQMLQLCRGQDLVYHVAALSTPWESTRLLHDVNVGGTRNVVEGCLRHGVQRLVHVSSTAIFFDFRDRFAIADDEPLPLRFVSPYAASKAAAERMVQKAVGDGLNAIIVRARAVFGPGDNSLLPRLLSAAEAGQLRQIGRGHNIVDLTYIDNLVYALALAAGHGKAGAACTVSNQEPVKLWPLVRRILQVCDLHLAGRPVPYRTAFAAAALQEWLHSAVPSLGEPAITRYAVGLLAKSQTFDGAAAQRELGYQPLITMQEGIQRTTDALSPQPVAITGNQAVDEIVCCQMRLFSTGLTRQSRHVAEQGAPSTQTAFHASCALLEHPTEGAMLFDTGYAPRFFAATRRFPYSLYRRVTRVETNHAMSAVATLRRLGIEPDQVQTIILSHFHADHMCGLRDFPQARFVVSSRAWTHVRQRRGLRAVRWGFLPGLLPGNFATRVRAIERFGDAGAGPWRGMHDLFGDGSVRLVELLGHAAGQMGALVRTAPGTVRFLVADAVWTTTGLTQQRLPHPVTGIFIHSFRELKTTMQRLYKFHRRFPEAEIIPTHCPEIAAHYGFQEPTPAATHEGK
jgi:nucleoside-diphosphate-sugar epimerase/glyoxylase-like metal-dependent hydrolase (beta-lactamase superfamily II)